MTRPSPDPFAEDKKRKQAAIGYLRVLVDLRRAAGNEEAALQFEARIKVMEEEIADMTGDAE